MAILRRRNTAVGSVDDVDGILADRHSSENSDKPPTMSDGGDDTVSVFIGLEAQTPSHFR